LAASVDHQFSFVWIQQEQVIKAPVSHKSITDTTDNDAQINTIIQIIIKIKTNNNTN
jgi:hypothetical protein